VGSTLPTIDEIPCALVLTVVHGDFEWDADKAARNIAKHGVSFEEAASAMSDPVSQDFADGLQPANLVTLARHVGSNLVRAYPLHRIHRA